MSTCPPISAVQACRDALERHVHDAMPARCLSNSSARCDGVPVPAVAQLSASGRCLASATTSANVRHGESGRTTSTLVVQTSCVTGARSRSVS